jgi:hypothetical protein
LVIYLVDPSIPDETDQGFGIFVSGEDPPIREDDGGNTRNTQFLSEFHIFING